MKKVRVKVERIDKRDTHYLIRYRYADMKVANVPLYGSRQYGATDELGALVKFKRCMQEVNYEVVCDGI